VAWSALAELESPAGEDRSGCRVSLALFAAVRWPDGPPGAGRDPPDRATLLLYHMGHLVREQPQPAPRLRCERAGPEIDVSASGYGAGAEGAADRVSARVNPNTGQVRLTALQAI